MQLLLLMFISMIGYSLTAQETVPRPALYIKQSILQISHHVHEFSHMHKPLIMTMTWQKTPLWLLPYNCVHVLVASQHQLAKANSSLSLQSDKPQESGQTCYCIHQKACCSVLANMAKCHWICCILSSFKCSDFVVFSTFDVQGDTCSYLQMWTIQLNKKRTCLHQRACTINWTDG